MKNLWVMPILLAASQATGGGWEASTLDTSLCTKRVIMQKWEMHQLPIM